MTGSERREEGRARDDASRAPGMFFFGLQSPLVALVNATRGVYLFHDNTWALLSLCAAKATPWISGFCSPGVSNALLILLYINYINYIIYYLYYLYYIQ